MSTVLDIRVVLQQFQSASESVPTVLRDDKLTPTVEEVKVLEINLPVSIVDQVVDLSDIENPLALYFFCDQEITTKLGDGTAEATFTNIKSGALNFGTAATQTPTLKVTTPGEFPIPVGETVAPTTATLYVFVAGDRT